MYNFPKFMKSRTSNVIVRFDSMDLGEVVDKGESNYGVGYKSRWNSITDITTWEDYTEEWIRLSRIKHEENIKNLDLFQSTNIIGSSHTLTRVPNGYVLTSHSGHQLFIKDSTKELI